MQSIYIWLVGGAIILGVVLYAIMRKASGPRPKTPAALRAGQKLPEFSAVDEDGNTVSTNDLAGSPAAILFIRGNWCPFCTKQVEGLTQHYRDITDLGAKLIFVTPKPLGTTRRVAEFFKVDFDFWLDDSLQVTRSLGLLHPQGVPDDYRKDFGADTVWPTTVLIDADGIIRYSKLSNFIIDRPNPDKLLDRLKQI